MAYEGSGDSERGIAAADASGSADGEDRWGAAMAAAQAGDQDAYRMLLEDVLPFVRRQVRSRISASADAEDVVQNALIAIHRGRHTYRPERPFGPWMRTVVRHCMIDWFRERGRRTRRELAVEEPDLFAHPAVDREPGSDELSGPLAAALAALPANQREAVELIHLHGLSVAEAALRAGVSPGALKVRAHRGYRALRAKLESGEGRSSR